MRHFRADDDGLGTLSGYKKLGQVQWLGDDKNVHMREVSLAESTNEQRETQLVGNSIGIQGLNSAAAKSGTINEQCIEMATQLQIPVSARGRARLPTIG